MKKIIVIGLMGEKGCGKGTVADYFINNHKAKIFHSSGIIKNILKSLNLPASRENLIKMALFVKKKFGKNVIMEALIARIEDERPRIAIVDSIRMKEDMTIFTEKYNGDFYPIFVEANVKTRWERTRQRNEKAGEGEATFEEFLKDEQAPTESKIYQIGKRATFILDNNGEKEELMKQIKQTAKEILKNYE